MIKDEKEKFNLDCIIQSSSPTEDLNIMINSDYFIASCSQLSLISIWLSQSMKKISCPISLKDVVNNLKGIEILEMILFYFYKVKILFKKLRKKKFIYIDSNENLENCIEAICKDELLGIDTEFLWRNTYYPILSLVQINSGTNIYIVDCIKINNIKLLNKILEDVKIIKVFHSLRGDVSVLKHALDSKIVNVLDTQIAEQLIQNW